MIVECGVLDVGHEILTGVPSDESPEISELSAVGWFEEIGWQVRRAPMLHFLSRRALCDILEPGASLSDFAVKASPEDWRRQGHVMIQRNLYQQAEKCFQQSGDRLRAPPRERFFY